MARSTRSKTFPAGAPALAGCLIAAFSFVIGCGSAGAGRSADLTLHEQTAGGSGFGNPFGAAALVAGQRRAEELLVSMGPGAGDDDGPGPYIDRQEERLARIPGIVVERAGDDALLVRFDSDALFNLDSAVFAAGARETLDAVAGVLARYPRTGLVIQGYTGANGSTERNQELSERRARAVYEHFAGHGVAPDRMAAVGYGERDPVVANTTVEGRRLNRRINVLIKASSRQLNAS